MELGSPALRWILYQLSHQGSPGLAGVAGMQEFLHSVSHHRREIKSKEGGEGGGRGNERKAGMFLRIFITNPKVDSTRLAVLE